MTKSRRIFGLIFSTAILIFGSQCSSDESVTPPTDSNAGETEVLEAEKNVVASLSTPDFSAAFIELSPGQLLIQATYSMDATPELDKTIKSALKSESYIEVYQKLGGKDANVFRKLKEVDALHAKLGLTPLPPSNGRTKSTNGEKTSNASARAQAYTCYDRYNNNFGRQAFHNTHYKLGTTVAEILNFGVIDTPFSGMPPYSQMVFTTQNGNYEKAGFQKSFIKIRLDLTNGQDHVADIYDRATVAISVPITAIGAIKTSGPAIEAGCKCGHLVMDVI